MIRWLRLLFALLCAAVLATGSAPAAALEPAALAPTALEPAALEERAPRLEEESGAAAVGAPAPAQSAQGADESAAAPAVPHDAPITRPGLVIPPVPASYVTKDLGWLELAYPPRASERVAPLLRDAEAIKAELAEALGQPVLSRVVVRVAPTPEEMARLAPAEAPPPAYASGVAYRGLRLVLLTMMAPRGAEAVDLEEVFRHELAHVALEDALRGEHVPVWFNEGLAISLSGELAMARTKTLWSATLSDTLLPLSELDRSFPRDNFEVSIAYAQSADFMRFLMRRSDRLRFTALIERVREGEPFERAVAEAYGADLRRLELEWRGNLEKRFSVIPALTGGGVIWVLVIAALVAAYVRRRRRTRAILERWGREEALEDERRARRARAMRESAESTWPPAPLPGAAVATKVEHHGRWHTLH